MIWEITVVAIAVILFLALGYLYYSGLFYPVNIVVRKPYPNDLPIAYKYAVDNYNIFKCGQLFQEFRAATSSDTTLIGIYYDNPDEVGPNACRYAVGAVLTGEGERYRDTLQSRGYSFMTIPTLDQGIVCDFPMTNDLSILTAVYRVYSAMFKYMKKEGIKYESPMMEIYTKDNIRVIAAFKTGPAFRVAELAPRN